MGITTPKVVYLSPNEAREAGLDVTSLPIAPDNELTRDEWCKANPKECRLQGEALLEKQNSMARSMFGMSFNNLTTSQQDEVIAAVESGNTVENTGTPVMTQQGADNVPPILVLPEDIIEDSDSRCAVIVRYTAYATDNSGVDIETVCEPKFVQICGVDDAGRGSMIGPLVIAGISIEKKNISKQKSIKKFKI